MSVAFDRAAHFYDETRGFPPGEVPHIARLVAAAGGLTTSSRVCEVGIALPLAAHVRLMTGVDLARPMLARLLAKRGAAPCCPVEGDVTRLPFASGTFDAAVAVHIFHLIPDWPDGLREVARVLRPGGVLIAGWNEHHSADPVRARLFPAWEEASRITHTPNAGVPREQYHTFLTDSGWRRKGEHRAHRYTVTNTAREVISQLERRVWSSTWRLSDEDVARGLAAVHAVVAEEGIDLDAPQSFADSFAVETYLPPG